MRSWCPADELPARTVAVILPPDAKTTRRKGLEIRRAQLAPRDITVRRGLSVTAIERTLHDLALYEPLVEAVVVLDAALRARITTLAEPKSESPMETRLRLLLVLNGLPHPEVQAIVRDARGNWLARADLYFPHRRLVIEYDGRGHRDTLAADTRRQNKILGAGYRLLRFTAADLAAPPGQPPLALQLVRGALARAA